MVGGGGGGAGGAAGVRDGAVSPPAAGERSRSCYQAGDAMHRVPTASTPSSTEKVCGRRARTWEGGSGTEGRASRAVGSLSVSRAGCTQRSGGRDLTVSAASRVQVVCRGSVIRSRIRPSRGAQTRPLRQPSGRSRDAPEMEGGAERGGGKPSRRGWTRACTSRGCVGGEEAAHSREVAVAVEVQAGNERWEGGRLVWSR